MKNTTVTLFVAPDSLIQLSESLTILDRIVVYNDYELPRGLDYNTTFVSNFIQVNIPIGTYLKFRSCCKRSKIKTNRP